MTLSPFAALHKPYGNFPWLDGESASAAQFSCQGWDDVESEGDNGGIEWTLYSIDAFDYLGNYCNTGDMDDRGTELDWQRFFWDLDRESTGGESMSFYTIVDLYGASLPTFWTESTARSELEAAFATSYATEWGNQDHNGIFR